MCKGTLRSVTERSHGFSNVIEDIQVSWDIERSMEGSVGRRDRAAGNVSRGKSESYLTNHMSGLALSVYLLSYFCNYLTSALSLSLPPSLPPSLPSSLPPSLFTTPYPTFFPSSQPLILSGASSCPPCKETAAMSTLSVWAYPATPVPARPCSCAALCAPWKRRQNVKHPSAPSPPGGPPLPLSLAPLLPTVLSIIATLNG